MSAEFARVQQVFLSAVEGHRPEDWEAYLDQACAGDGDLRDQVRLLLKAHLDAGSVPGAAAHDPDRTNAYQYPAETAGTAIGPYKLVEPVGEGGMGTVWLAQQTEPVKRLVAVKLIKAGMDSKQVVARFEAERQALALMDHPNIARVLDGGTTAAGRPYFVMDLVKGVPITRYCDDHHLTPRQRLELFVPVCQAVQHAHQKGVIHRDLKPSNVLVAPYDGKPVPKVIDFGVAKAAGQPLTDRTLVTGFGNIVGTLEYMSPEQAELNNHDIDTRSDIYSLGVLLYELLAGSPPFTKKELEKAGMLEMLRVIREQEPSRPSTKLSTADGLPTLAANRGTEPAKLTRLVRGELDWIVMKALEKDRSRRYETATGFAADAQRYLADEPVQACPPSAGYRLRKFVRRNKAAFASTGLSLLILLTLTGGIGWNVRDRAARDAEAAQEQAARRAKSGGQVESIFAEVDRLEGEQKWPEALAAARRTAAVVAGGEADDSTAERVRRRLRDLEFIDRLEQIRMQRATLIDGRFNDAGADRDYALAFRGYGLDIDALAVETSIDRLRARRALIIPLAAALDDWISARRVVSKADSAGWQRLVTIARGIDPEPLRDRLRAGWGQPIADVQDDLRRLADSIDVEAQHPTTLYYLSRALRQTGNPDSGLRILRDAQSVYPGDFWLNFELGQALSEQKDYVGAIRFRTAAVSVRPNSAAAHINLSYDLLKQKQLPEAITACRRALKLDPNDAIPCSNLALALFKLDDPKKLPEALALAVKAIELDPKFADGYNVLGMVLGAQNKLDDAIAAFQKAIELNPKHPHAYTNLATDFGRQGKYDQAIACCRKALDIDRRNTNAYHTLDICLRRQGKLDESIDSLRKALEIDRDYMDLGSILGKALSYKGWQLVKNPDPKHRDPKRAVELAKEAVELAPQSHQVWQLSGWIQYRTGNWKASIEALQKSCELEKGGDCGQWIVLALAHARLAAQEGLPDKERDHFKAEARRWFNQADKQIDGWGHGRPGDETGQSIWDFRIEARTLMGVKEINK